MKKNRILVVLLGIAISTLSSCKTDLSEYLDDYSTILYLRNSDLLPWEVYDIGENSHYKLIVNKAGSDRSATASADIQVLSEVELDNYNRGQGTTYRLIPADCYTLDKEHVDFSSDKDYQSIDVTLMTDRLKAFLSDKQGDYVVAVRLSSITDSVNAKKKYAFVAPTIKTPTVRFKTAGYNNTTLAEDGMDTITINTSLVLSLADKWGITCQLKVDPSALARYNEDNDTDYKLLDRKNYTFTPNVSFTKGATEAVVPLTIKKTGMDYGKFVLPLSISHISKEGFIPDESAATMLVGVSYTPPKITVTPGMLSTNALEPSEGSLAAMLDGNISTYFHSAWSVVVPDKHYVQVALTAPIHSFVFTYITRKENGNAAPKELLVSVSTDGKKFENLRTFTLADGLPQGAATLWESTTLRSEQDIKFIRFTNIANKNGGAFFVWSEFSLAGK